MQLTDEQIQEIRSFVRKNVCLSLVALCKSLSIISTEFEPVLSWSHYCELLKNKSQKFFQINLFCSTHPSIFRKENFVRFISRFKRLFTG